MAFDIFTSRPGEGETTGGVLLGKAARDGVEVTDFWHGVEKSAEVVGYWSIRRRLSRTWEGADGEGIYLVVSPVTVQRADALVWQREADGSESEVRAMTIQVERRVSNRPSRHTDVKPQAAASSMGWVWWGLGCLALAGLALWMTPAEAAARTASVALTLQGAGNALRVRWRESGSGDRAGRLESAAMVVRHGQHEETVDLMDRYAPEGDVAVQARAQVIVVSLRVRRAGQPPIMQTVTYVSPVPAAQGKIESGEVEWLRWRNRELEETVARLKGRF